MLTFLYSFFLFIPVTSATNSIQGLTNKITEYNSRHPGGSLKIEVVDENCLRRFRPAAYRIEISSRNKPPIRIEPVPFRISYLNDVLDSGFYKLNLIHTETQQISTTVSFHYKKNELATVVLPVTCE